MFFYCVRHGESEYNRVGRIQGWLDVPLSSLGESQAESAAIAIATLLEPDTRENTGNSALRRGYEPNLSDRFPWPQRVFASPLRRAWRTAEHVATRLNLPMEPLELLKEIQIGEFQGQVGQEVALRHPELWQRWLSFDPDVALPGGETRRQLAQRGVTAFRSIAQLPYQAVVIVSHGAILTATFKSLMGIPPDHPPYALQNGSITTCELTKDGNFTMFERDNVDHLSAETQSGPGDLPI